MLVWVWACESVRVSVSFAMQLTIKTSLLAQEADFPVGIAPDEADDHGLLFPALEPVHAAQLNAGECLLERSKDGELLILSKFVSRSFSFISCWSGKSPQDPQAGR